MPEVPILWMNEDPKRLERDLAEVHSFAPSMTFEAPTSDPQTHGSWRGVLPRWPFERPEPPGLDQLLGETDFEILVTYPSAYPMTPPTVYPLSVAPEPMEHSQSVWHVAPGGSLCLLQSTGGWLPEASVIELLQKAAGWRIEYALMKEGAIEQMTTNGIVSDDVCDSLIMRTESPPWLADLGRGTDE